MYIYIYIYISTYKHTYIQTYIRTKIAGLTEYDMMGTMLQKDIRLNFQSTPNMESKDSSEISYINTTALSPKSP